MCSFIMTTSGSLPRNGIEAALERHVFFNPDDEGVHDWMR